MAGAFADKNARENCLFHKPGSLSFDAAALTEPLSGAWKGVVQYSEMKVGDDVVVIGVGSIGLMCLLVAHAAGAGRLIAIYVSAHARQNALKLGATHAIDPGVGDAKSRVYEILPEGPDLVVEAAGPIGAVKLMVELRRRGTRWNVFGITTHEKFELDGGLTHFLEGRMDASFGTTSLPCRERFAVKPVGSISKGNFPSIPAGEIHEAIIMANPDRNKIIIHP